MTRVSSGPVAFSISLTSAGGSCEVPGGGVPFLHRHCLKASGPARAVGGRHLPRLRIKCVLFLGEGKRGQWSMANI